MVFCPAPNSRTTCYNGLFGDRTCRTTTDHPTTATTTCRPTLFGDRCTTRITSGVREDTTCRTNLFGDTNCRTTYSRPHSFWGPTYTSYSSYDRDCYYPSSPSYAYRRSYSYDYTPCNDGGFFSSLFLGIMGITCLAAAFGR